MVKEQEMKKWHVSNWELLGWIETALKILAFMFAYKMLYESLGQSNFALPQGQYIVIWIIQIVLSMGLIAAIFDRYKNKEIFSMIFVVFNNFAHWSIVIVLGNPTIQSNSLILFFTLMLLGDFVKIIFLKTSSFSVLGVPKSVLYGLTFFYVLGYLVNLLILVF